MHLNSDRLTESLTPVEVMHIQSCTRCKQEREKLMALKISANQLELVEVPHSVWQGLETKLPIEHKKQKKNWLYASAASIFMLSVSWLFWSNHQLQQQFEEVLLANQILEEQLYLESLPVYSQVALVSDLEGITTQLYLAKDKKEKVRLLNKRREVFQKYFEKVSQGERKNEFSI